MGKFSDQALSSILRELCFVSVGRVRINEDRHSLWCKGMTPDIAKTIAEQRSNGQEDLL